MESVPSLLSLMSPSAAAAAAGELLGPDEVHRLNEAARKFAQGIRFSLRTDNLPPLNVDPALETSTVGDASTHSTSEEESSMFSGGSYKSEALRLRVKVTALEEEVVELRKRQHASGRTLHPEAVEQFQRHVAQLQQAHRLETELHQRELQAERQKAAVLIRAAEAKATDGAEKVAELHGKCDRRAAQHALDLAALAEARQVSARREQEARDASTKVLLLEQRIDFVCRDREARLAERDAAHRREVEHVAERYRRMLRDLRRAHAQLQRQYAADLRDNNSSSSSSSSSRGSSSNNNNNSSNNISERFERNSAHQPTLTKAASFSGVVCRFGPCLLPSVVFGAGWSSLSPLTVPATS